MFRSRGIQYVCLLAIAALIAAVGSHLVAAWLNLKVRSADPFVIGTSSNHVAFLAGSSVADYGVDWERIASTEDFRIHVWGIAAGSPVEHEQFQQLVPDASTTFIAVSAIDLDEALVSDFRAAIVPLSTAIRSLSESRATLSYAKEVLSQYPITWLRTFYPTLGRSRGIMGAARIKLKALIKPNSPAREDAGPTIKFAKGSSEDDYRKQKMSDWSEAEIQKKLVAMRVTFKGRTSFNGLKHLAFSRMLRTASGKGHTIVLILPASPAYKKAFLPPEAEHEFEDSLNALKSDLPNVRWLRMDRIPTLSSPDYFCDLSHLNQDGKAVVTDAVEKSLREFASLQK